MREETPFLLNFLDAQRSDIEEIDEPYNPELQSRRIPQYMMAGTQSTRSWRNLTTKDSIVTGHEDYDDEYITQPD